MKYYDSYFVDGLENKENFRKFLCLIFAYSDAFSLIYFKYREGERTKHSTAKIEKELSPFKIDSRNVTQWPGTMTLNEQGHIYRMVTYNANMDVAKGFEILDILGKVKTLWDWVYPKYPMDLCLYKNGYAWFASTTHECLNVLYLRKEDHFPLASDLESIGLKLIPKGKVAESKLFYHKYAVEKSKRDID